MKIKIGSAKVVVAAAILLVPAMLPASHKNAQPGCKVPVERTPATSISNAKASTAKVAPSVAAAFAKLPLAFEKNLGQTDPSVQYTARGQDYQLFLTHEEAVLALRRADTVLVSPVHHAAYLNALRAAQQSAKVSILRFGLAGANPSVEMNGVNQLPGRTDYFVGNNPKNWHTDVPSYGRVAYRGIYPGIDLVFYGNQRRLEYDFVVAPGAEPKAIALNVSGASGLRVDSRGNLVLNVSAGDVQLEKPVAYQEVNGERREIAANYALAGNDTITFAVSEYDASKPLIIDPVLDYSTYLGGSTTGSAAADTGYGIAVDASGDAYVAGLTYSMTFPTLHAYQASPGANTATNGSVFVTEINPAGTAELYSTYLSGSGTTTATELDNAFGVAIDPAPSANCPNALSAPGTCVYVTGITYSTDFPTTVSGLNPGPLGSNAIATGFLSKLNPALSGTNSLVYSTFLGGATGTFGTTGQGVAVDATANAYVTGFTDTTDFPQPTVPNGFQQSLQGANGNAFLAEINTTLSGTASLIYSTYLGGNGTNPGINFAGDQANGVTVDTSGKAYLAGITSSTNFPTTATVPTVSNAGYQTSLTAGNTVAAGFLSIIDTTKSGTNSLFYSTYLSGNGSDEANAIALGPSNVAYVTGDTNSTTGFPSTSGAYATASPVNREAFITLIDGSQSGNNSLKYSTFLGGSGGDQGFGIAADASGNAYVTGGTASTDFPLFPLNPAGGAFQMTRPDTGGDAFISQLSPSGNGTADLLYSTYFGGDGSGGSSPDTAYAITVDSSKNVYVTGKTYSAAATFPVFPSNAFQTTLTGTAAAFVAKLTLEPRMAFTPATLTFTGQVVGVPGSAQSVTLTNNTNSTVTLSAPTVTAGSPPASSTDFAATNGSCTTTLLAGASCTVNVTFTASVTANETATLNLNSTDSSSPQQAALSSTGTIAAVVTVSPSPTQVTFVTQVVNTTSSPARTVTITDTGNAPLTFSAAPSIAGTNGTPSTDFAIVAGSGTTCTNGATVQPNATCTIALTFTPSGTTPNPRTANLTLTDNATGSPQLVALSGTAALSAPIVTITSPTPPLTFASQIINTTSAAQTVTVENTGNAALNLTAAPAIAGTNGTPSTDFAIVTGSGTTCTNGATVQANATCTIAITFTPSGTTPNPRTATLSLTDNASGSPQTLAITGTAANALAPIVTLTPSTGLTFTGQLVTTTSTAQTVTVKNTGTAALIFGASAISISGADFAQTNTCNSTSVAANATCTISVTFTPTSATNPRTGTLSIADNAAGSPQTETLTGTGEDYTVTATAPAAINPGQSVSIPVTVIGLGGYTGSVSFACSGTIPGGSCVAPGAVSASPTPGTTATFMVTTTAFVAPPPSRRIPPVSPRQIVLLFAALLLFFSIPAARRVRTRLSLAGAMLLFIVLAGCSGTPPVAATPAGPYTFSITASSGGVSHAANVVVTVN